MANIYTLVQDRLGMGTEAIEVLQEKAQRMSILSGFIAREVFEKKALNMSANEIRDTALLTRTVHPENEGIYNGKEPFDPAKNKARGDYSLKVAEEKGISLTDAQKAVIKGEGSLIEGRIIKLAETIIAVQYKRIQRGIEKEAITDSTSIMAELLSDNRIDTELVKEIIGEKELENIISAEKQSFTKSKEKQTKDRRCQAWEKRGYKIEGLDRAKVEKVLYFIDNYTNGNKNGVLRKLCAEYGLQLPEGKTEEEFYNEVYASLEETYKEIVEQNPDKRMANSLVFQAFGLSR